MSKASQYAVRLRVSVKDAVRNLLGDAVSGMIDYYRFPARKESWGGPFNGQARRRELFTALLENAKPVAIVETGSYLGATTEFMARTGIPVYSIEGNSRSYGFARARLWRKRHVTVRHGDSRAELKRLFEGPLSMLGWAPLFFYLDAHWNEELPLAEELNIIFSFCKAAVVMIDDFQVPGDDGYAYDDYGPGKALTAEYTAPLEKAHGLTILYPSTPSCEETGARRGCAVLYKTAAHHPRLQDLPLLRRSSLPVRLPISSGTAMRCPTIAELPPPPPGKTGWPWTVESPQLPDVMPDGKPWPRISIVTPSYNQGRFIEETIRSVLLQGYPDVQYIIVDGGSTDGTAEIICKYERFLSHWTSGPDRGQAHAINKGLADCTGTIFNWINSDDIVAPGAFALVAPMMTGCDAVAGTVLTFGAGYDGIVQNRMLRAVRLIAGQQGFHQPGLWLRRESIIKCGGIDETYYCSFDWDLIIRYFALFPVISYTDRVLVHFRYHENSKSMSWAKYEYERTQVLEKLLTNPAFTALHAHCSRRLRRDAWWRELNEIRNCASRSPLKRALDITLGALRDPRVRFDRYTAGAVRALLRTVM